MTQVATGKKIHILANISGNKKKQDFFNAVVKEMDHDWPFGDKEGDKIYICKCCKGRIWSMPRFQPGDLKALASQINLLKSLPGHLKIKIKQYRLSDVCLDIWKKEGKE